MSHTTTNNAINSDSTGKYIKILQANVARRTASQNLAQSIGAKLGCYLLCLQEPNSRVTSLPGKKRYPSTKPDVNSVIYANYTSQNVITVYGHESFKNFSFIECDNICIYSVYVSPNCGLDVFVSVVDQLFVHVQSVVEARGSPVIICGDFNAKNKQWGGHVTDRRGEVLQDAAESLNLFFLNNGKHPTLVRHNGTSFIDVTIVSEEIIKRGYAWSVLTEEESLSDHLFIQIEIGKKPRKSKAPKYVRRLDPRLMESNLRNIARTVDPTDTENATAEISACYQASHRRMRADENYALPYWWNDEIQSAIVNARKARRTLIRETRNDARKDILRAAYKEERKRLSKLIRNAKKKKWRDLCDTLDNDLYGNAYMIIKKQLQCTGPQVTLKLEEKIKIFRELFITETRDDLPTTGAGPPLRELSMEELLAAAKRIKVGTSPGPDGILPAHVKNMITKERPTLWNILYDDVMDLEMERGVELLCYADDLVIMVRHASQAEVMSMGDAALSAVGFWMARNRLELAPEKTTSVVFKWSYKNRREICFRYGDHIIRPVNSVRYLGVTLDYRLSFSLHTRAVIKKADNVLKGLSAMMPNIGGPRSSKRKIFAMSLQSIILYAAPVWGKALEIARNKRILMSCQRKSALRCISAYHTVSGEAALVLAGLVPLTLMVEERTRIHNRVRGREAHEGFEREISEAKREERDATVERWQREWRPGHEESATAVWTKKLIPDIRPWIGRKFGEVTYAVCQFLSGHGCFASYLYKFKRRDSPACAYGDAQEDTPEHMLFQCVRFEQIRVEAELRLGENLTWESVVPMMVRDKHSWDTVTTMMKRMVEIKEGEERQPRTAD
ncbi:hypothetical protein HUJ04_011488 [Dendroctonus ponderosae]|nr:hypothetical protein HUJ04_011488 [Dendroctonus ponderosae]